MYVTVFGRPVFDKFLQVEGKSTVICLTQSWPDSRKGWFWLKQVAPNRYEIIMFMAYQECL